MKLFEAIVEANHRAVGGDKNAVLHLDQFQNELPIVALTCIDPRLDPFVPGAMGIPPEQFIWLRNAGNIITGPLSSTMRSLALACAVKGGKEIALIGHTDCKVRQTTVSNLIDQFRLLGIDRSRLPENLVEYFGLFASERQNVIKGCDTVRASPLIGPRIPVHGLMMDIQTGSLEWVVNGYQSLGVPQSPMSRAMTMAQPVIEDLIAKAAAKIGDIDVRGAKIGEWAHRIEPIVAEVAKAVPPKPAEATKAEPSKKDTTRFQPPWKSTPWRAPARKTRGG